MLIVYLIVRLSVYTQFRVVSVVVQSCRGRGWLSGLGWGLGSGCRAGSGGELFD